MEASIPGSFDRHGPAPPDHPVVLSVPHAGRDYPLALRAALGVPLDSIRALEDRYVDAVALAARGCETLFVQRSARAWIDLNRAETERDPAIDEGADARRLPGASARLRGGLGLVPRRANGAAPIWRRRFSGEEIEARIAADHRPYHRALAQALHAARARFGHAVLLDLHSMPSIAGADAPQLVIGDRFGRSATGRLVSRIEQGVVQAGWRVAINSPYAGGHVLDMHGAPADGIHAVQIEIDRAAYLDRAHDLPGPGLDRTAALLRRLIDAVADEAAGPLFRAAE